MACQSLCSVRAGLCLQHQSAGALASHGAAFSGPWPEGPGPGTSEGSSSGAVDSDSKPQRDVGHHWDWEAADRADGDSLKVAGCSDGGGMLGMYGRSISGSSSVSPCKSSFVSFWSLGFIAWATKTLLCPFLLAQNQTQGGMI
jgi:hypothetical protein